MIMCYGDKFVRTIYLQKIRIRYQRLIRNCDIALENCKDLDFKKFWSDTRLRCQNNLDKLTKCFLQ